MSFCRVLQPGALTTVQDKGRFGFQKFGMGTSGVMDREAYAAANWLVGNENGNAAVLEMTLVGAALEFLSGGLVAVTGANMSPLLNGEPAPIYQAFRVKNGDVLKLGMAVNGCRAYLAFAGGIDVPVVMNSRSTNLKCALGGFEGRALKVGDELSCLPSKFNEARKLPVPEYQREFTVRFVPGPQADMFSEECMKAFCAAEYQVSAQSDRMGARMDGEKLTAINGTDIVSDGIAFGSIQVSNSGQPIVLLADRQTTGGYAKIGTVISRDLPLLAQATPGAKVHFEKVSVEEAQRIYREGAEEQKKLRN
jgi:biotin-dependent carboxylase-like uncharacterized protein